MNPARKVKSWSVKGQCCVMLLAGRYFTLGQYMYTMTSPPPSKNRIIATTWSNKATRRNNNIVIMIESHLLGGYCPGLHLLLSRYINNYYYWTCIHSQDIYHWLLFSLNYNPFSFHRNLYFNSPFLPFNVWSFVCYWRKDG